MFASETDPREPLFFGHDEDGPDLRKVQDVSRGNAIPAAETRPRPYTTALQPPPNYELSLGTPTVISFMF